MQRNLHAERQAGRQIVRAHWRRQRRRMLLWGLLAGLIVSGILGFVLWSTYRHSIY